MGAITSFVLGMGVTVSACYIFLAIVLGPALIEFGIDPVASHLFILYWGMLSYITPPVALAAVAASVIAGSKQMETAITAMRLGSIKFVLPFILVLTPALILRGEDVGEIVAVIAACSLAIVLLAAGFEGYLYGVGRIGSSSASPYSSALRACFTRTTEAGLRRSLAWRWSISSPGKPAPEGRLSKAKAAAYQYRQPLPHHLCRQPERTNRRSGRMS